MLPPPQESYRDRVPLCSPGCPGTCYVDQSGLKFRDPPECLPSSLSNSGIKGVGHDALVSSITCFPSCSRSPGTPGVHGHTRLPMGAKGSNSRSHTCIANASPTGPAWFLFFYLFLVLFYFVFVCLFVLNQGLCTLPRLASRFSSSLPLPGTRKHSCS